MLYSYHLVSLRDAKIETAAAFAAHVAGPVRDLARAANGELLGLFLPQLGFAGHERALLFRWRGAVGDPLAGCALIGSSVAERMSATARPGDADQLKPEGIVVHRWFAIAPADKDEFVQLSIGAWGEFESDFDSGIFGLFAVEPRAEDGASLRMLLLTGYGGHADWELSRRPSAASAANFRRRQALTKFTRAASTALAKLAV